MDKKCPNCGESIPEETSFCLHCFTQINTKNDEALIITDKTNNKNKKIILIIGISIILIAALLFLTIVFENKITEKESEITISPTSASYTNKITAQLQTEQSSTTKITIKNTTNNTTKTNSTTVQAVSKSTTKSATKKITNKKTTNTTTSTTKIITTAKTTNSSQKVIIDNGILNNYPKYRSNSTYTIPYSVTKITNNAFNNNMYLKSLKFSKRENLDCDFKNLFSSIPNLETIYVYPGTDADLIGLQYFNGEIVYYD